MKLIDRIKAPTPLRWKKIMLYVITLGAGLGSVVANIPAAWIDADTKVFLMELIGFLVTIATFFSQTRVKKHQEEV